MNNYYTPSGKSSPLSFILFAILSLVVFPILGGLYTYAVWYIPFIYISFLLTFGLGVGIGFLMNKIVIQYGKIRNPKMAFLLCVLGAFVALYFQWAVWADLVLNSTETTGFSRMAVVKSSMNLEQIAFIAVSPKLLFQLIVEVNSYGTWGLFEESTVSGVFLWIVWGLESLIVIVVSLMFGGKRASNPFCERGNKWFKQRDLPQLSYIYSKSDIVADLEQGTFKSLSLLHLYDELHDSTGFSVVTLFYSDMDVHYLSIINSTKIVNDKGEVSYEEEDIIQFLEISPKTLSLLEGIKKRDRSESSAVEQELD